MKCSIHSGFGLALALALIGLIPFVGGCGQSAKSAPQTDASTNQPTTAATPSDTTQTDTDATVQADNTDDQLANAPGTIISTPAAATAPSNNPQLGEVVKLVQAGVGDSILMAYVTNSPSPFKLSSDDVVYLNDLGAPQSVINAMLQRDQYFNAQVAQTPTPTPPPDQSGYVDVTPAPLPQSATDQNAQAAEATAQADVATPPLTPPPDAVDDAEQEPNGSYSYFYDSLSPYGNWINVNGYGPCWQPTTVAMNPGWQPYCDGGHWIYTDCGWCWVSDYSWGWAPFHYGRWFHSTRFGWCWAPDTVWGPAWVSWRYNGSYCGWAPLPPAACYRPGFGFTFLGRSVGVNFTFGLGPNLFVFVPLDRFHDRGLSRSRVNHQEVEKIYRSTTLNNQLIRGPNNTLINHGVPVQQVAAASHTEIRAVHIRADVEAPGSAKYGRDGRSLSIYRPSLPAPRPSARQTLAGEGVQRDANFNLQQRVEQPRTRPAVTREPPAERRPIVSNPTTAPTPTVTRGATPDNNNPAQPNWNSTPNRVDNGTQRPNYQRGQTFQPQPTAPAENNRQVVTPQQPAPRYSAPQQWQQRSPAQEPNVSAQRQEQLRQQQVQQEQVRQSQMQQEQVRQEQLRQNQVRQEQTQQEQVRQQQFQQEQMRQEQLRQNQTRQQEQFRQEQPRQDAAPRTYEQPRSYESHSAPPAQSAPSHQDSSQNNNSGNNNNNGNGNSGGGGRGH